MELLIGKIQNRDYWRFAPLDFTAISGYPNPLLGEEIMWCDHFSSYQGLKGESVNQHLSLVGLSTVLM
jgi:hypothetical protein